MIENRCRLKGKIASENTSAKTLSKFLNITQATFSLKMNSERYSFSQGEILLICKHLNINVADIPYYFFNGELQSMQQSTS